MTVTWPSIKVAPCTLLPTVHDSAVAPPQWTSGWPCRAGPCRVTGRPGGPGVVEGRAALGLHWAGWLMRVGWVLLQLQGKRPTGNVGAVSSKLSPHRRCTPELEDPSISTQKSSKIKERSSLHIPSNWFPWGVTGQVVKPRPQTTSWES